MKLLVLLLGLVLAANGRTLLEETNAGPAPSGDHRGSPESPGFDVLNKTNALEVRLYENATWAVAFGRSRFLTDLAAVQAGIGLAKYFKGCNVEHKQIERTIPIVGTVLRPPPPPPPKNGSRPEPPPGKHGKHHPPHGPPAVALAAFIPRSFKGSPPLPECRHVKLLHTNATKVYVHKFGGWAISWTVGREIGHLAKALKDEGICPRKGKFFVASYDGPWKLFDRHNEVWWVERPEHRSATDSEPLPEGTPSGFAALDAERLFPEEFSGPPQPVADDQWGQEADKNVMRGHNWFAEDGYISMMAAAEEGDGVADEVVSFGNSEVVLVS